MKLFFETASQASCFLIAVPLGFLFTLCLDTRWHHGWIRLLLDLLLLGSLGCVLVMLSAICREERVRLYHWLGLLTGAVLYLGGIGRIRKLLNRRMYSLQSKMHLSGRKKDFACRTNTEILGKGDEPCAVP